MAEISQSNLLTNIEGIHQLKDALVVLVKTEWNAAVVARLTTGCKNVLNENGIITEVVTVPGAVEIPFAIKQYWQSSQVPAAFIALACVVRGDTPHFDYVCQSITQGITQLNLTIDVPVIFGVLTVENYQQAEERVGGIHGHKGEEAAVTAMKMMMLNKSLKEEKS